MSGIAGIVRLDGAPAERAAIEQMERAISHRGPDCQQWRLSGSVALAYVGLHTVPESHREVLPLIEGSMTVVGDVRLDNRQELLSLLQAGHDFGSGSVDDSRLILAAYRQWGAACVPRLEGDFAFAIWDERARVLFCARDVFGVKPFVYTHVPGVLFAFASEACALLTLEEVPRGFDESRIADFIDVNFDHPERTFYRAVKRLPGGCSLTQTQGGQPTVSIARYWIPESVRPFNLRGAGRNTQYAEGFLERFTSAVRNRMRVEQDSHIGAMLSGGLDSSAIACVARDLLPNNAGAGLPVFSWVFSDCPEADEREYQQAVIAAGGFDPVTLDTAIVDASPWTNLDALLANGPVYAPNHYLTGVAAKYARERGVLVLLDGTGGDATISRGRARLTELMVTGQFWTLAGELRAQARHLGSSESLLELFLRNVAAPLMPASLRSYVRRLRGDRDCELTLLTPRMTRLRSSATSHSHHGMIVTARQEHLAQVTSPMLADGLELLDRSLAIHAVEGRYPFFDRRLTEYCISLPADQKLHDGYSRVVARRALGGSLPEAVRWRAGKGMPGLHVTTALRRSRTLLDDLFVLDPSVLEPYLNIDALRSAYNRFLSEHPMEFKTVVQLWSAAVLGRWLRR